MQETKLDIVGSYELENYILFHSPGTNKKLGTGFLINKTLKTAVIKFEAINDRLCSLRLRGQFQKLSFINVHMPTEEKSMNIKEMYFDDLRALFDSIPNYDLKIVMGDTNARLGKEEIYRPEIGPFSKHGVTSENGKLLVDFAKEKGLIVMSTYFRNKEIHKGTWRSPDGKHTNQIDHVLIEKCQRACILNIRAYRGADINSDHFLLGIKLKPIIPKIKNQRAKRKVSKLNKRLRTESDREEYKSKISERLQDINVEGSIENIENMWKVLVGAMNESTPAYVDNHDEIISWFDEECARLLEEKNKARKVMLESEMEVARVHYKVCRKKCQAIFKRKKRRYMEKKLEFIERMYESKNVRALYAGLNTHKSQQKQTPMHIRNENGEILINQQEVLERWRSYFDGVYNEQSTRDSVHALGEWSGEVGQVYHELPTLEEIGEIIHQMRSNKSSGTDGITAEMIKYGGNELLNAIHVLIIQIWMEEKMPIEWYQTLLCPIHKKGDRIDCHNYRGIALINTVYKVLAITIKNRLVVEAEKHIGEYQCGFRKNRSVVDQIFVLKELQAQSHEHNLETHLLFIDFKQAYDRVSRCRLLETLAELGICEKLIRMTGITLATSECQVRLGGKLSSKIVVKEGLRQGDPLSPVLFNLILENVIRKAGIYRSGLLHHKSHQCLAYADDIAILTRSMWELKHITRSLIVSARHVGLELNETKTKYMKWSTEEYSSGNKILVTSDNGREYGFEEVDAFKYLGATFTRNPDSRTEIQARIQAGNRSFRALHRIFNTRTISRKLKINIYRAVVRPVVVFGSEVWTMTRADEMLLEVWERKVLRSIYRGKIVDGQWQRRSNIELRQLYPGPTITGIVRSARVRWMGHARRQSATSIPRRIMDSMMGARKRRGRPRSRWMDQVETDLRRLNVVDYKHVCCNKNMWKIIVNEALNL